MFVSEYRTFEMHEVVVLKQNLVHAGHVVIVWPGMLTSVSIQLYCIAFINCTSICTLIHWLTVTLSDDLVFVIRLVEMMTTEVDFFHVYWRRVTSHFSYKGNGYTFKAGCSGGVEVSLLK